MYRLSTRCTSPLRTFSYSPAVSTGSVHSTILTAHHKVIDVAGQEGETGDGHRLTLLVLELHAVL